VSILVKVIFDEKYCKGCYLCSHFCPKKIIVKSDKRNSSGYTIPIVVDLDSCSECKTCEYICPELAVTVLKEGTN